MSEHVEGANNKVVDAITNADIANKFSDHLKLKAVAGRKISKADGLEDAIGIISRACINFNSMDENEIIVPEWNRPITECIIHEWFKPLILPNSVRKHVGNMQCIDVLNRPDFQGWKYTKKDGSEVTITHNIVMLAIADINRSQKKDSTDNQVDVSSLRRDVSVDDVIDMAAFKSNVKYNGNPFVPIILDDFIGLFYFDNYFNASIDEVLEDYFITFEL